MTPRGDAVKDPELEAYVSAIEGHLKRAAGRRPHPAPRATSRWPAPGTEAGLPLATVLVGMDRAFERNPRADLARLLPPRASRSWPRPPTARAGAPRRPSESVPVTEVSRLSTSLLERLSALPPLPRAVLRAPLAQDLRGAGSARGGVTPELGATCERSCSEIDDDVSAAVLQALPRNELDEFRAEAAGPSSGIGAGRRGGARGRQGPLHPAAGAGAAWACPG